MQRVFSGVPFCLTEVVLAIFLSLPAFTSQSAGFNHTYIAYQGDINADNEDDLYVKSTVGTLTIVGGIPVVNGPPVRDFLLRNNGDGSFVLVTTLSQSQKDAVRTWPESKVDITVRDADVDGHTDLDLVGVYQYISGGREQIVLSDAVWGAAPASLVDKTLKFKSFHNDLLASIFNPDYFEDNAPLRITSSHPSQAWWYGGVSTEGYGLIANLLEHCFINISTSTANDVCVLSDHDPSPCVRLVRVFNEFDQEITVETRDVCGALKHVWIFIESQIEVEKDYSVFDQDAMETKEVWDRLNTSCSLFETSADTNFIDGVMGQIYGSLPTIINTPNSLPHRPAPGDGLFDPESPTFHHYDKITRFCSLSQPECTLQQVNSPANLGIRFFNHPSIYLHAFQTPLDGSDLAVFVTEPWNVYDPSKYDIRFGEVTQQLLQADNWENAIQNITTPVHYLYPGTVTRHMWKFGDQIWVWTHGIGENQFFCVPASNAVLDVVAGVRMIIAAMNDQFGPRTFATLDRQMRTAWGNQWGTTTPPAAAKGVVRKYIESNPQ